MSTTTTILQEAIPQALQAVTQGDSLMSSVKVDVAAAGKGASTTIEKPCFILDSQPFFSLKTYLTASLKLPKDDQTFESFYPPSLFEPYCKKDNGTPPLYKYMKDTLVGISSRCYAFENEQVPKMLNTAGGIAEYADAAERESPNLKAAVEFIGKKGADLDSDEGKENIKTIRRICSDLAQLAQDRATDCQDIMTDLQTFSSDTRRHQTDLNAVDKRTDAVFPTIAELDISLKSKMADARTKMIDAYNKMRKNVEARKDIGNVIRMGETGQFVQSNPDDLKSYQDLLNYEKTFEEVKRTATAQLYQGLKFRERVSALSTLIDDTVHSIDAAIVDLGKLSGIFSKLSTNLNGVVKTLGGIKGVVDQQQDYKYGGLVANIQAVQTRWKLIGTSARDFQERGGCLIVDIKPSDPMVPPTLPQEIEILAANWGGGDVTGEARILFYDAPNAKVSSQFNGFTDTLIGTGKVLSLVHSYGGQLRLLKCGEYTGVHNLVAGDISKSVLDPGYTSSKTVMLKVLDPPAQKAGSPAKILGIVFGVNEVTSQSAYDYCYECMNNFSPVEFSKAKFGDGAYASYKIPTGVVFYTTDDGKSVRMVSGKDMTSATFHF